MMLVQHLEWESFQNYKYSSSLIHLEHGLKYCYQYCKFLVWISVV